MGSRLPDTNLRSGRLQLFSPPEMHDQPLKFDGFNGFFVSLTYGRFYKHYVVQERITVPSRCVCVLTVTAWGPRLH
jgi:hypothetical protein